MAVNDQEATNPNIAFINIFIEYWFKPPAAYNIATLSINRDSKVYKYWIIVVFKLGIL